MNEFEIDTYYNIKDLSNILKVCKLTVKKMIEKGKIKAIDFGSEGYHMWRVSEKELNRFLKND